jgi:hypothetical protein
VRSAYVAVPEGAMQPRAPQPPGLGGVPRSLWARRMDPQLCSLLSVDQGEVGQETVVTQRVPVAEGVAVQLSLRRQHG